MEQHSYLRGASAFATGASVLAVFISACGGTATPPAQPLAAATAALPAAIATGCVYPGTAPVTAKLPAAGGIGGTLTVGAVAQASTACSTITVATGSDATLTASNASTAAPASTHRRTLASSQLPTALAQISLTNDYSGNMPWQGVTLTVPPLSLPAGTYPTTITVDESGEPFTQN